MKLYADLHIHTIHSDGILNPAKIFDMAEKIGLRAISITDHDTIDGCREARTLKEQYNIEFIDGIELSCYQYGREYHLLGYFIDINNNSLLQHLEGFRNARFRRGLKIIEKIQNLGLDLSFEEVLEKAGDAPIARPHFAMALADKNLVNSYKDAFNLYLADNKPCYEPKQQFSIIKGKKLINDAGGVYILAHPGRTLSQQTLYDIIELGIDGIEVIHPIHDTELQKFYHNVCNQYWLLETGGSDFHGTRDYDYENFGRYVIPLSAVDSIRNHTLNRLY